MSKKEEVLAVVSQPNHADGERRLSNEVSAVETVARDFTVECVEDYEKAANFGRILKQKSAEVTAFFAPMKKAAHEAHKHICDREKAMLAPIVNAEKMLKRTMAKFQEEQERKQREEEARLRALAKAEEERLMAEAIQMEAMGETEMAEEHFENAQFMENAARNIAVPNQPVKAEGVSTSVDWVIESIDPSKVPVEFLNQMLRPVDEKAVIRLIRAHKGNVSIPGVVFKKTAKLSFRK